MSSKDNKPYYKQVLGFYFAPLLRSFVTVLYLGFFVYFALFYFENIILALRFIWYTINISTPLLDIAYLFWGALFFIALLIPFSLSLYAIVLPYEIMKHLTWDTLRKWLIVALVFVATIDAIILADKAIHLIADQPPIIPFVEMQDLGFRI